MSLFGRHSSLGLACSDASATSVHLQRSSSHDGWTIRTMSHISWKDEGVTNVLEVNQALGDWLQENRIENDRETFCVIRQSDVNTVISDFPPVNDMNKLSKMIDYQTRQLGGLSGVSLVHSFQGIPPNFGQGNPMLIAVSREDALNEAADFYQNNGIKVGALVPEGLALFNAFELLHPEAAKAPGLQAIMHSGAKSCTMLLLWNGTIQSINVLDASYSRPKDLLDKLQVSLRHWKEMQTGDARLAALDGIWLSGEGPDMEALRVTMAETMTAKTEILGVPASRCPHGCNAGPLCEGCHPAMTVAFGLAAQSLGMSFFKITLLPECLAWRQMRISQFPFLVLSAAVIVISLCVAFASTAIKTYIQTQQLNEQEQLLNTCLGVAPKLSEAYKQITLRQLQMLPIAEAGLRTQRFVKTLKTWQECAPIPQKDSWCFYLADEFSFAEDNAKKQHSQNSGSRKDSTRGDSGKIAPNGLMPPSSTTTPTAPASVRPEDALQPSQLLPQATPVSSMQLHSRMYAGGILLATRDKYQALKDFQRELNRSDYFVNVDDYTDYLSEDFRKRVTDPWEKFLNDNKDFVNKDYALFLLQLPFKESPVSLPQKEDNIFTPPAE
ncbi:MAG: hypothetical protein MJ106_00145 [Lentisphaeria bacterium]|nr:hypothetical protein [Lentisphaeria bacterium]